MEVQLRNLKKKDAETSWKWRNDPEVWKLTGRRFTGVVTKKIEEEWILKNENSNESKRFAICVNADRKYIGNVQLTNILNNKAIFHIFIGDKEFWGKGVAKKATKLMLKYGFNKLNLDDISLTVDKDNKAAIVVYKRNGFNEDVNNEFEIKMSICKESFLNITEGVK